VIYRYSPSTAVHCTVLGGGCDIQIQSLHSFTLYCTGWREVHSADTMEGCSVPWHGVSGVPGLGCPVSNQYTNTALLRLWEEGAEERNIKNSFSQKVAKFFSFRKGKSAEPPKISSVPKTPVRRSFSAVNISQRRKTLQSTDTGDLKGKSKIKRSASLGKVKSSEAGRDYRKVGDKESDSSEVISRGVAHSSEGQQKVDLKNNKHQATQTDIGTGTNIEDYDYVYSNWISPAMLIKLTGDLEDDDENDDTNNVYEEINVKETKIGRSNSLFTQGQTEHIKLYRLREQEQGKDNYIRPQTIKQELMKKIQGQRNTKSKNVTFSDSDRKLRRSRSAITTCQPELYPGHYTTVSF